MDNVVSLTASDSMSSPSRRGGSSANLGDHETSESHSPCFFTTYCAKRPTWVGWKWNRIWWRPLQHLFLHQNWSPMTAQMLISKFHGRAISFNGLYKSIVTDLGYSVKWPSAPADHWGGKLKSVQALWKNSATQWRETAKQDKPLLSKCTNCTAFKPMYLRNRVLDFMILE